MSKNVNYMELAIKEAKKALKKNEVPIGAVIVKNGKVISCGYNKRQKSKNAVNHAEIIAIVNACKKLKDWRLNGCTMYVTLKPCPMCAGAICNARIDKVVYGAEETNSSDQLCEQIFSSNRLNHKPILEQDVSFVDECSQILTQFFQTKR